MNALRVALRRGFDVLEAALGIVFQPAWNPLCNLGALGFFFYWIITVSGIYVYIFFDTGVHNAYASIEYMTHEQWYLAGIMRSLHRYASDALIIVMLCHILREFSHDRYRGVRWFSWVTGIPILIMVYIAGISGYWLVWDKLAQYVAIVSTEWLDLLGVFGEPIARNFLSPDALESRFFTLMIFMHIAIPLIALAILWIHLQRVTKPRINPPRGLALSVFGMLMALSLIHPALSQGPADLAVVPGKVGLDWFYLPLFPLLETLPGSLTWGMSACFLFIMIAIPWLPPMKKARVAQVDLANCNGCARCYNDCPYNAITLVARTDGTAFEREPIVDPSYCVSCGICAGSCPTSMPFRRLSDLSPGIDLPDRTIASLRERTEQQAMGLAGNRRIMVFGCDHGPALRSVASSSVGVVPLACIGQLPPAFIDYVLSKDLADGVILTGCREEACDARFGIRWTNDRLAGKRDPHLRKRVPRERLVTVWAGALGTGALKQAISGLSERLETLSSQARPAGRRERPSPTASPEPADA
jgi:ferredoxin/coenzyme F420-reducing hydrogenase delta subunit